MSDRKFVQGNEAIGWGALYGGCDAFFGYPITPQNEIPEWFAREFPPRGKVFVQSQSELGSINMVYGAACIGARTMTSTASPGWSLMMETMSNLSGAELPCVIVLVQRGGPGGGSVRHAQMDYTSATRGGGHGGYKNIVLAPASVQECHDLVQLAFYLADKYRNPVVVLSDGLIGQVAETLEVKTIDFGPLPDKDWATTGLDSHRDKRTRWIHSAPGIIPMERYTNYIDYLQHMLKKYQDITESEVRFEYYRTEDAELLLVAYGYSARVCKRVVDMARPLGINVGLIRPITLWPFPYLAIKEWALKGCKFIVVEDSLGQLVEDVRIGVEGREDVHLMSVLDRHIPTDGGIILPGSVLRKVRELI